MKSNNNIIIILLWQYGIPEHLRRRGLHAAAEEKIPIMYIYVGILRKKNAFNRVDLA